MVDKRAKIYTQIKIVGFVLYIPFILCAGPLAGYFSGDFLVKRFHAAQALPLLLASIGLIAGIVETVKIIRIVLKIEKGT